MNDRGHSQGEIAMRFGMLNVALVALGTVWGALPAAAQVQERTIRWGHLNNTDHPVSFGVQKFAEVEGLDAHARSIEVRLS